ncbi:TetR/AcrR family transcriptional regulator [Dysgonomonas sp. HDW5A]|uniref:TetR/AcrR family transcriptional regulator n=1 Tax=Dysgonomonas sp. HDW5A TaxID=2714926 RepID=UPI00140B3D66|nr:TetR/AcrR family transcriptional regulator [Dysgonomonas sp. HDW5A]QIK58958.1 TetR/AcrR family transcriptional regulator [Dysgonomonas sp. HDW5A]
MVDTKELWIKTGYDIFAKSGITGLKIERLAKKIGISKSSFYHHFVDLDLFIQYLLEFHISQSYIIAKKEVKAQNIDPDLIDILVEHKVDLLFNRQLRINREQKKYSDTLTKSSLIIGNAFTMRWVKDMELRLNEKQLEAIFELALENFYLQATVESINHKWLLSYFAYLKRVIGSFV